MNQTQHTQNDPFLLSKLLPTFVAKVARDDDALDLTDAIPAGAYKGAGRYVISVNPKTGNIDAVCDGTEEGSFYKGGLTPNCAEVFNEFALAELERGNIALNCMFSHYKACSFELFFEDEAYTPPEACLVLPKGAVVLSEGVTKLSPARQMVVTRRDGSKAV